MSQNTTEDFERGPNGWPYLDTEGTSVSRGESGDYHLKIEREDGEMMAVDVRPDDFEGMSRAIDHVIEESSK